MDTPLAARDDIVPWLRLTLVPGVTLRAQVALLKAFESAAGVLAASPREIAAIASPEVAQLLAKGPDGALVDKTLAWLEAPGRRFVPVYDDAYPKALLEIPDPPSALYVQGRAELLHAKSFAIVGSRNATPQGARDSHWFAHAMSDAGFTIVSGLALGIDSAAHRGGLAGASSSVAVMGTGPDIVYPRRNHELAHTLAANGCLVTEFPVGMGSLAGNFPRRNRLISGLARGVLVVEAGIPSGSLNTAAHALEQGREVFAIPGSIHSPLSKGCHQLLQQGAKLVESAEDILVELGERVAKAQPRAVDAGRGEHDAVLEAMGFGPATVEQLSQRTGLDAAKLAAHLSRLEIAKRIEALPGGRFQRVKSREIE